MSLAKGQSFGFRNVAHKFLAAVFEYRVAYLSCGKLAKGMGPLARCVETLTDSQSRQ